ncbi:MAG: hypothetical protein LBU73_02760 [Helicobacteraceae bacterium]|nr:hypothetical protein [Helicobacteraceae bacterium]
MNFAKLLKFFAALLCAALLAACADKAPEGLSIETKSPDWHILPDTEEEFGAAASAAASAGGVKFQQETAETAAKLALADRVGKITRTAAADFLGVLDKSPNRIGDLNESALEINVTIGKATAQGNGEDFAQREIEAFTEEAAQMAQSLSEASSYRAAIAYSPMQTYFALLRIPKARAGEAIFQAILWQCDSAPNFKACRERDFDRLMGAIFRAIVAESGEIIIEEDAN